MIKNIIALFACVLLLAAPVKAAELPSYSYFSLESRAYDFASEGALYWSSELSETGFMWVDWEGIERDDGCISTGTFIVGGGLKFDLGESSKFDLGLGYGANAWQDNCGISSPSSVDTSVTAVSLGIRFAISDSAEGFVRSETR